MKSTAWRVFSLCALAALLMFPSIAPAAPGVRSIRKEPAKNYRSLLKEGEALWTDASLGRSGSTCSGCHAVKGLMKGTFPRYVPMTRDILTLDQMINFCVMNPMQGEPLAWNSRKLTALAAYITAGSEKATEEKNPCSMKNPCSTVDPRSMKSPRGGK